MTCCSPWNRANGISSYLNPFLFIKNKQLFISSEGFFALEKNAMICSQRAMLPIQLDVKFRPIKKSRVSPKRRPHWKWRESNKNVWFPFMYSQKWNCVASFFPQQNYNVLSPNFYTHISVRDLYISRIGLSILLQPNMWTNPENTKIYYRQLNVEFGTETAQFPEKEYINGIFLVVHLYTIFYKIWSQIRFKWLIRTRKVWCNCFLIQVCIYRRFLRSIISVKSKSLHCRLSSMSQILSCFG